MPWFPCKLERLTFDEISRFIRDKHFRNAILWKLYDEGKIEPELVGEWHGYNEDTGRMQSEQTQPTSNLKEHQ